MSLWLLRSLSLGLSWSCSVLRNLLKTTKVWRWGVFSSLILIAFETTPYSPKFECIITEEDVVIVQTVCIDSLQCINDTVRLQYMTLSQFKDSLGHHESRGNYNAKNPWGFRGKYQFGPYMINKFAYDGCLNRDELKINSELFLHDSLLQEKAMDKAIDYYIKYIYKYRYDRYINTQIDSVTVTMEGLMLGVHFSPLYLKNWLETNGKVNRWDANISIKEYIRKFESRGTPTKKTYLKCRML